ncbi:hypothetical protein [Actinacidiphila bryophytorum]|uniref:Uncharacterized protein n=1 Tax=Actinacidiphila bryophytorum TaxID=1436133 RepID=A0A9W4MHD6_9ACTN|nr:hypothetical protein [Actinacidiphila bryophytorum]MBM9438118.1 hypothetical protein [Actinacidiphila bryophytorum]MBN6543635.1 hypothetical protein [Actinacidiphila bryophytorum]CAG7647445.1 conserved exported hypothetical protein [Actinacidiphila bryophytorum]
MRRLLHTALALSAAGLLSLTLTTSAQADGQNVTIYTSNRAGVATFKPYGEHLLVNDLVGDGWSAVARLEVEGYGTYYYWDRQGAQYPALDIDLDFPEGHTVTLTAFLGKWAGTPDGGIDWSSYDHVLDSVHTTT